MIHRKPTEIESLLAKVPVFENLKRRELRAIAGIVHRRQYVAGEYVFYQDDPGLGMYVIEEGEVVVALMEKEKIKKELAVLKDGDFFGELALLDESPRSASVIVRADANLIGFFRPDLFEVIEKSPATGLKILLKLAEIIGERLRSTNQELAAVRAELDALTLSQRKEPSYEILTEKTTGQKNLSIKSAAKSA
ncbi:MAG: cyclic nucleotide-binding domain-containing protein [Bacteroidota bacterium]|nr:cyclic nucleotide-binding domain-containing protein [Bacteroidota bacterium]